MKNKTYRAEKLREIARDFQADVLIYGKAYASSYAEIGRAHV